jgi:hypothetical protein
MTLTVREEWEEVHQRQRKAKLKKLRETHSSHYYRYYCGNNSVLCLVFLQ